MSKKGWIILLIVVLIIVGGVFYLLTANHLEGLVYDSKTGKVLSGAKVTINKLTKLETDKDGRFRAFSPPMKKVITVEKPGYKTFEEVFPANFGLQTIEISLEPLTFSELVEDFKEKASAFKSYSAEYLIESETDGSKDTFSIKLSYSLGKGIHFISEEEGENTSYTEVYIINDYVYLRDGKDKEFKKIEKKESENIPILRLSDIVDFFTMKAEPSSFTFLKETTFGDEKCAVFKIQWEDAFSESSGFVYLGEESGIIRKISVVDKGFNEEGKTVTTEVSFVLEDLNKPVEINPPS